MSLIISIDLWGTLFRSSPDFVDAKVALTKRYFKALDNKQILECYSDTKKELNAIIEQTGMQPSERVIFTLLFSKLSDGYENFELFEKFVFEYQFLAQNIPPHIYSEETKDAILRLSEIGKLYISSNTMFISGTSLKTIIFNAGIGRYFDRFYFSDQIGESKPSRVMYGHSNYHIGDNVYTDGIGAKCANSHPIIINSNDKTLTDAYNFITQNQGIQ